MRLISALLGRPLARASEATERLPNVQALPILSSESPCSRSGGSSWARGLMCRLLWYCPPPTAP